MIAMIENTPMTIPDKVSDALSLFAFNVLIAILISSDKPKTKLNFKIKISTAVTI